MHIASLCMSMFYLPLAIVPNVPYVFESHELWKHFVHIAWKVLYK